MKRWFVPFALVAVVGGLLAYAIWGVRPAKPRTMMDGFVEYDRVTTRIANTHETTSDDYDESQRLVHDLGAAVTANPQAAIDILDSETAPIEARRSAAFFLIIAHVASAAPNLLKCTYSPDRMLARTSLQALDEFAETKTPLPPTTKTEIEKRCEEILWHSTKLTDLASALLRDSLPETKATKLLTDVADHFGFGQPSGRSAAYELSDIAGATHDAKLADQIDKTLAGLEKKDPKDAKTIEGLRQSARTKRSHLASS